MTAASVKEIERICVVRFGGMGDILLTTPAVRALALHFKTSQIDFIVGRGMAPALEGIGYISNVTEFDKSGIDSRPFEFASFLRRLHDRQYDLFVNFQPSAKTILMSMASGARSILTFRKDRRHQPATGRVRHAIDDFTKELKPIGVESVVDRRLDFVIPDSALARARCLLSEAGIGTMDVLIAVNAAGTREINRWPPDKFVGLIDALPDYVPRCRVVLTGGPADFELNEAIRKMTSARVENLAGRIGIKELGAVLSLANVVVSGDTGPMHIASAVGAPLVVLSGAADPDRTGPISPLDLVVINRDLPCVPCQGRTCKRGDIACMTQMPVDWVLQSIGMRLMAGRS